MEREKTRLVGEGNTIYEIDLTCMRKKEIEREKVLKRQDENQSRDTCRKR